MELFNLLNMAYQERDEAKCELHKLMNEFTPSSPIHLQNQSLLMLPLAKANNSSITESKSLSHDSLDSFFDAVSSPEFSNINVVVDSNNNNMGCLNQHMVQDFNSCPKPDPANEVIDFLAKGKPLPQKGKLLQAVMDAGPLLHTLLLAGPLPTWRNPPPLQQIKVPQLTINKDCATTSMELNSFVESGNSLLKPKLPSSLYSSNSLSKCSASMLNFDGHTPGSSMNNNAWQLSSSSGVRVQVPSRKRQRHQ